jgi:transposase
MDATSLIEALLPAAGRPMRVRHLAILPGGIVILIGCDERFAPCPDCACPSKRVASRYLRTVADVPWRQMQVKLRLEVRRFFCDNVDCHRKVFAEQFPQLVRKWGRTTVDHEKSLVRLGLICGGEAGAQVACKIGMPTSGDTVLRRLRKIPPAQRVAPKPRSIGIDDFAFRKGSSYGTVIVDHESGGILDILPERSSESTAAFLAGQPQVDIVTRDRSDLYANGISTGLPEALQVADRFHLQMNLRAALVRLLDRHRVEVTSACQAAMHPALPALAASPAPVLSAPPQTASVPVPVPAAADALAGPLSEFSRLSKDLQARRVAQYEQVTALRLNERLSIREIRKRTNLNVRTIAKYVHAAGLPARAKVRRSRPLRISSRHLSWLLLHDELERKAGEQKVIDQLRQNCQPVCRGVDLVQECRAIFQQHESAKLLGWIERAKEVDVPREVKNFAKGLEREWPSIKPAIELHWNNGRAEGHVNRIKLIKRQMYGRAKFDLLRIRVLARGP